LIRRWALILPSALGIFQVFLAKTFFQRPLPASCTNAARIDGCSELQVPDAGGVADLERHPGCALPALRGRAVELLLQCPQFSWKIRAFTRCSLVLRQIPDRGSERDNGKFGNLQQYQRVLRRTHSCANAVIVVATVPMLILYPFAQRYFAKGVMLGSLKD